MVTLLRDGKGTQQEAWELFDSLGSVGLDEVMGLWRGRELFCGHPLEGLLTACNWYGKRFESSEVVYPMLFCRRNGRIFSTNPRRMPLSVALNRLPDTLIRGLFRCAYPYVATTKKGAHLEMREYRGLTSVAMVYEGLAVTDYFRRLDDGSLLGIMDLANDKSGKKFFFILSRELL
jgi:hypothetical protein